MNNFLPAPLIEIKFNKNLLSIPYPGFKAEYILKISNFLEKKISSSEYRKFPNTVGKLTVKHMQLMELYEQAKIKEEESKGKTFIQAKMPFYRPRLANRNDQRLFERLDNRRKASEYMLRKYYEISKI